MVRKTTIQRYKRSVFLFSDTTKKGFITSTEFIIIDNQLSDGKRPKMCILRLMDLFFFQEKSYLGLVFDMIDTPRKG